jgi:hypothetical protein
MKKVIIFTQSREKLKIVIKKKLNGNKNLILIFMTLTKMLRLMKF